MQYNLICTVPSCRRIDRALNRLPELTKRSFTNTVDNEIPRWPRLNVGFRCHRAAPCVHSILLPQMSDSILEHRTLRRQLVTVAESGHGFAQTKP